MKKSSVLYRKLKRRMSYLRRELIKASLMIGEQMITVLQSLRQEFESKWILQLIHGWVAHGTYNNRKTSIMVKTTRKDYTKAEPVFCDVHFSYSFKCDEIMVKESHSQCKQIHVVDQEEWLYSESSIKELLDHDHELTGQ